MRDRLTAALAGFKNRDAAWSLALFLARYWSMPGKVSGSFFIDRRALADRPGLDLSEARVRGAIRTLEAVGFLDRAFMAPSSGYRETEDGLRRAPVAFCFGGDYARAFKAANARSAAARERPSSDRRGDARSPVSRPSTAHPDASISKSPKSSSAHKNCPVHMGQESKSGIPPAASELDPELAAALERLKRAAGIAGGR